MNITPIILLALSTANVSETEVRRDTVTLPEFTYKAPAKTNVTLLPLNTSVVTAAEINKSTETNLLPVLVNQVTGTFLTERGFAGYGVSGGSAGTFNIRGVGQGNKVLFMIDGQPHWAGVFGHSLPDTYVANGVERVEIIKGPASLLYGPNAMGGAVNIITRHADKEGLSGRARAMFGSFSTQKFDLSAGFKKDKVSGTVSGQIDRSNGNRANSEFWNANEFINIDYTPSSNWELGTTVEMNQSHANNPGTTQDPLLSMWTTVSRGTASIYAKDNYGFATGGVQAYINWGRNKVDDGHAPGADPRDYIFNSSDYNMGFSLFQTFTPWQGNRLSAGVDFMHWGGHNWNLDKATNSVKTAEFREHENEIGGYVMMQQGFVGDLLSLNAGVRLQHGSQYGNQWIPQAGFILRPFSGSSLKFSFGKGFRAPNLRELYLYAPANPDLKPEYMWNYDVELRQWLFDNRLNIGLSLFFIDGKDMIQTVRIDGRPKNMNTGSFINKGIEIEAAFNINSDWRIAANYSYLHTDNKTLLAAPKNKLNAQLDYNPGNLELSLESNTIWSLMTGAPDNATTDYSLLNFRAAYTFTGRCDVMPFLKIDNITNRHYEIIYGCPMPGTTLMGGVEIRF